MSIDFFKTQIVPRLTGYKIRYSFYTNGDFGDLARVEFEKEDKLGTVDFWSQGWMSLDVYSSDLDNQLINLLLSPVESEEQKAAMQKLIKVLEENE